MGFVLGEIMEKESMAKVIFTMGKPCSRIKSGMGFVPGEVMKKQSKAKVIFTMGKPGSRIIGDGFCPWRNYEEGVQGECHFQRWVNLVPG